MTINVPEELRMMASEIDDVREKLGMWADSLRGIASELETKELEFQDVMSQIKELMNTEEN